MPLLSVSELSVSAGGRKILDGVSFDIGAGERVGIIGPNGSGKTTLFNCISGFMPPSDGSISFAGQDITSQAPHRRAQLGLGRVFQNFGIFRDMTVWENMELAFDARRTRDRDKIAAHLEEVGLHAQRSQKASSLSGGQMRLLEIARTMALGSTLFLLDEPTAGVSPKMKDEVQEILQRISDGTRSLLVIEHDLGFIGELCPRVLVLDVGSIIAEGAPEQIRANPTVQQVYFGKPL